MPNWRFISDSVRSPQVPKITTTTARPAHCHMDINGKKWAKTKDEAMEKTAPPMLTQVDTLLMLEVYPAGEAPIPGADSRSLCRTIRGRGKIDPILVPDPAQVAEMLAPVLTGNDLILVQGAGNIGKIARSLAEIKLKPQTPEEEQHD